MPTLNVVREEIVEAIQEEFGAYARKRAEKAADRTVAGFRARGWEVFTWGELNNLDDTRGSRRSILDAG